MDRYDFRVVVSRFILKHIGVHCEFYSQGMLADYLGVRQATVSSWVNENSDISLFTFFRIILAFSVKGKKDVKAVLIEFLEAYNFYETSS